MNKFVSILTFILVRPYVKINFLKEVAGENNFPKRNFILASNHLSHLDWLIDGGLLSPRRHVFIAQVDKMTGTKKFFRDLLYWVCGVVTVDRNNKESKKAALATAIEMVKNGYSLAIYPEGMRSRDGQTHEFRAGVGKIYIETGAPVVPSAFKGTYEMMPPGGKLKVKKTARILIGKPMEFLPEREAAAKLDKNSEEYRQICATIAKKTEEAVRNLLKNDTG